MARRSVYVLSEYVQYEGHSIMGVGETLDEAKDLLGKPAIWGDRQPGHDIDISPFPYWVAEQQPGSDFFLWVITCAPLGDRGRSNE